MQILLSSGAAFKVFSLKETEDLALSLGYSGLELMPPPAHLPPEESDRDTAYETLAHTPVMHAIGDIYDQSRFRSALDRSIAIAQQNYIQTINIHPASAAFGGRDNVVSGIEYIKAKEAETGLTITYEMLVDPNGVHADRKQWFIEQQAYTKLEDWIKDVIDFDLHASIDTCHAGTWNINPADLIEPLGSHLTHVHFSDFDTEKKEEHVVPGTGHVQLIEFLQVLHKAHPNTTLTVEINPATTKEEVINQAQASIGFIKTALTTK
jgi:sugar phosphate isomerase/epimerase